VTLSGIGGELPTGGFVPTPTAELQDLLVQARFATLARQLRAWARKMRRPQIPLLWEAICGFGTLSLVFPNAPKNPNPAPWFQAGFVARNQVALSGYRSRVRVFGPLPSFQSNIHSLNYQVMIMAYFGALRFRLGALREERYPYLDRELLEFAYAIPREQIVGVGMRRFLMKRALVGIVPDEILNRKPGAITPEPPNISAECAGLTDSGRHLMSDAIGVIDRNRFFNMLRTGFNDEIHAERLNRVLSLEAWLRGLVSKGILREPAKTEEQRARSEAFQRIRSNKSSVS
jgi:asparagine synthase (glutamine-hydrolysing)